jgi:hypothetical protein
MLRDWEPVAQYTTDENDIAADFYAPCMRDAIRYDRITGYFSSAIYLIVWDEIANFALRGGQMRVICSLRSACRTQPPSRPATAPAPIPNLPRRCSSTSIECLTPRTLQIRREHSLAWSSTA